MPTLQRQCPLALVEVVLDHARAGHGEAGEDTDRVEGDQCRDLGVGGEQQRDRHDGEHDDPVGEGEAVAAPGELLRQVLVLGDEAGEEGEAVEAGVPACVEDEHGRELDHVEEGPADPAAAEDVLDLLGDDGRRAEGVGNRVGPVGEERDTEHEERQDRAHHHQGLAGVDRGRLAEGADAVGDGLEAGERGTAVGERLQDDDERRAVEEPRPGGPDRHCARGVDRVDVEVPESLLDVADHDHESEAHHEEVRREREPLSGLADTSQVAEEKKQHDRDGDLQLEMGEPREGAGERVGAGGGLHRDGHRVVDEQRHRGDLGHFRTEVVAGDHVGAAGLRVELDDVEVRQGDEEQHAEDGECDRYHEDERRPDPRRAPGW